MKLIEEKIVEVAYRLFKQHGVRSTTLQQIARACDTSPWDVNVIFKSKKDLVLGVVKHTLNNKSAYLLINSSLSLSAVTELKNFFKFVDDVTADLGDEILTELRRHHPLGLDQLKELVDDRLIPYLQRNIERGLREGFYRNELDSERYVFTYYYILRTVLESERDSAETRKAITHINDIFLHAALNTKGMRV